MEIKEFLYYINNETKKINIDLDENKKEKFYEYMNLLIEWNEKINLTAITEPKEIIIKHFLDSLTVLKYIKPNQKIVDIGTGAGFPGIPIKIVEESSKITLVDSLNKRINFLNEVIDTLKLENIDALHNRAEEFGKNKIYREKYDIAISRAVARLNVLVEYLLPTVKVGGRCICMKGINSEEEIAEAKSAIKILGGELIKIDEFSLIDTDMKRTIIVIKKIKNTPTKFPRKAGIPSKKPIK